MAATVAFCAAALIALWVGVFVTLESQRGLALDAGKRELGNLALALMESSARTLNQTDQLAYQLKLEYGKDRAPHGVLQMLEQVNFAAPGMVYQLGVLDEHGALVWSTTPGQGRVNFADRDYFRVHAARSLSMAHVSQSVLDQTGRWTLQVTRRIDKPDGTFGGVALASIDPAYFASLFRKVSLGERGAVRLVGTDGVVRAASTRDGLTDQAEFNRALPDTPLLRAVRVADRSTMPEPGPNGHDWLWAFERIEGFQSLAVVVGTDLDDVLLEWTEHRRALFIAAGITSIVVLIFGLAFAAHLARQRRAAVEVSEREERYRYAVSGSQAGIYDWDCRSGTFFMSPRFKEIFGYAHDELPADRNTWRQLIHPDDRALAEQAVDRHFRERVPYELEYRIRRKDGTYAWVRSIAQAIWDENGEVLRFAGSLTDITDRKRVEDRVARLMAEQEAIFEATTVGIAFLKNRLIMRCNRHFAAIFGYERDEIMGVSTSWLHGSAALFEQRGEAYSEIRARATRLHELEMQRKDGGKFWIESRLAAVDPSDPLKGAVWSIADITERKEIELRLLQLAHYDSLTGLPNRMLLGDRLGHALAAMPRGGQLVGLLFIDLDRFKFVNDTLGHAAGDTLLREAAERLRGITRATDTIARLGGDEFALVLPDMLNVEAGGQVAEKVLRAFEPPFTVGDQEVHVTTSIGIAVAPHDGNDVEELVRNADVAMYRAKSEGRNTFRYYAPEMNARARRTLTLENELRRALERSEFRLHYQPRVDVTTGRIIGVEALLRWQKDGALISPAEFVPILEETGLIVPAGEWVLAEACQQAVAWAASGGAPLRVAVNVSARQFARTDFAQTVERVLAETGLEADRLELELTESTVMQDAERTVLQLERLKECGVRVAIDDFGTGYSSLSYLKRFAVDELKIDRSFIKDLPDDTNDAALTAAIIAMAHSLGISVTAEGVETEAQRTFLESHRCDEYQGFYFSRPVPPAEILRLLAPPAPALVA